MVAFVRSFIRRGSVCRPGRTETSSRDRRTVVIKEIAFRDRFEPHHGTPAAAVRCPEASRRGRRNKIAKRNGILFRIRVSIVKRRPDRSVRQPVPALACCAITLFPTLSIISGRLMNTNTLQCCEDKLRYYLRIRSTQGRFRSL